MKHKMVRPDIKGRITLGPLAKGVSSFSVTVAKDRIILKPYVEVPADEQWLFNNKEALKKVNQGIKEANQGKLLNKGSFAESVDDGDTH